MHVPARECPYEVVEDRPHLVDDFAGQNADPEGWLPEGLSAEDIPAMLSLDFAEGSIGVGVEEHPEFLVEVREMLVRPAKLLYAPVQIQREAACVHDRVADPQRRP